MTNETILYVNRSWFFKRFDHVKPKLWMPKLGSYGLRIENYAHAGERKELENDPTKLQLIPYIVVTDVEAKTVLVYKRNGSEKRLSGQWSIGIGGHWRKGETLQNAIIREVKEEIGMIPEHVVHPNRFIYDDTNEVGRVHLGILFVYLLSEDDFYLNALPSDELRSVKFVPLDMLDKDKLETWSQVALSEVKNYVEKRQYRPWDLMNMRLEVE